MERPNAKKNQSQANYIGALESYIDRLEMRWRALKKIANENGDVPFCRGWLQQQIKIIEEE